MSSGHHCTAIAKEEKSVKRKARRRSVYDEGRKKKELVPYLKVMTIRQKK